MDSSVVTIIIPVLKESVHKHLNTSQLWATLGLVFVCLFKRNWIKKIQTMTLKGFFYIISKIALVKKKKNLIFDLTYSENLCEKPDPTCSAYHWPSWASVKVKAMKVASWQRSTEPVSIADINSLWFKSLLTRWDTQTQLITKIHILYTWMKNKSEYLLTKFLFWQNCIWCYSKVRAKASSHVTRFILFPSPPPIPTLKRTSHSSFLEPPPPPPPPSPHLSPADNKSLLAPSLPPPLFFFPVRRHCWTHTPIPPSPPPSNSLKRTSLCHPSFLSP